MGSKDTVKFDKFWLDPQDLERKFPVMIFVKGEFVGRKILLARDRIVFGRSKEAGIMLTDKGVSVHHFRIDYDPAQQAYVVTDIKSTNGTFVNGRQITNQVIREGDKIIAGNTVLRYSMIDAIDMQYRYEIEQRMNIDELTGMVVLRLFYEELDRLFAVSGGRHDTILSMLSMDMDGLKQINDTHGHSFGAFAIATTGQLIKNTIDGSGLASRFGGDEFVAFLPDRKIRDAALFAEILRKKIEDHPYVKDGIEIFPTLSIGVAQLLPGQTRTALMDVADKALYQAKNNGRNCVAQAHW